MKIGVVGAAGRMGQMLLKEIIATEGAEIAGGTEVPGSPAVGRDLGDFIGPDGAGHIIGDDAAALFAASDVVIDFTVPVATVGHARLAAENDTALVIGTTGMSYDQQAIVDAAATRVAMVQAGNMSLGVNLLTQVTKQVAAALGIEWDVEVVEMHHRHKIDAPSGTALMLGRAAAEGRDQDHDQVMQSGRHGETGARRQGDIGYAALRGGMVVGDHTVIFASDNERIELTHKASDRSLFAAGAVRAALWLKGQAPARYDMLDVLGLKG